MTNKQSYIDAQRLAKDFKVGDAVLLPIYTRGNRYAPSIGRVTAILDKIGFVDVETPFGNIRVSPENLVKDNTLDTSYLEDTSMLTWERERAKRIASSYVVNQIVPLRVRVSELRAQGLAWSEAFSTVVQSSSVPLEVISQAVDYIYEREPLTKTAIYWKAKGRQYMPSKREIDCGVFECPCCRHSLEKTHYKKHTKLYVCRECLFTIRPADLLEHGCELEPLEDESCSGRPAITDFFKAHDPLLTAIYNKG